MAAILNFCWVISSFIFLLLGVVYTADFTVASNSNKSKKWFKIGISATV